MRVESVTAHAFGPLRGRRLEIGPGMTVIHGPNESGKSTWHAALYVGLCGMRRGSGLRNYDREFRDRHRPWDGEDWEVSAVVRLADGRLVELRHDLEGLVACSASDVDLGRDYSAEVMFEGTPDASRWLGLDRRSFLSTACVRQADIQTVRDEAKALQEGLQRAAATAGTDATAAAALEALDGYKRVHVGLNRSNSTRPLRLAAVEAEQARTQLEEAQLAHNEYLRRYDEVQQLETSLKKDEVLLKTVQAALARKAAASLRKQALRARELTARYPTEPLSPTESRQQLQNATSALSVWDNLPEAVTISSPTSQELSREIDDLPPMPEGDTSPHREVGESEAAFRSATSNFERHRLGKPPEPTSVETGNLASQELRHIAVELSIEEPWVDPALDERVQRAKTRLESLQHPETRKEDDRLTPSLPGFIALLFRILASLFRVLFGRGKPGIDHAAVAKASEELRQAENALGEAKFQREEVRKRREAAQIALTHRGLPTEGEAVFKLADLAEKFVEESDAFCYLAA